MRSMANMAQDYESEFPQCLFRLSYKKEPKAWSSQVRLDDTRRRLEMYFHFLQKAESQLRGVMALDGQLWWNGT